MTKTATEIAMSLSPTRGEYMLTMVRNIRAQIQRSQGLSHAPFSDEGWATIEYALVQSLREGTRILDENDEPLREMMIDYRNAHPLHAEGCFQRVVQWVKGRHDAAERDSSKEKP